VNAAFEANAIWYKILKNTAVSLANQTGTVHVCVALHPCNTTMGSWAFMSLMTENCMSLAMLIKIMNTFEQGKVVEESGVELHMK
jgi:hypothetical protein